MSLKVKGQVLAAIGTSGGNDDLFIIAGGRSMAHCFSINGCIYEVVLDIIV